MALQGLSIGILVLLCCHCSYIAETKYLGCYSSNHSNVFDKRFIITDLTIPLCAQLCTKENFTLIGLQYGMHCHCGREGHPYKTTYERVLDSECNMTCNGGSKCGGENTIVIYKNYTYIGCYSYPDVNIFSFGGAVAELTLTLCLDICQYFSFIGLTQGDHCYCGHEIPPDNWTRHENSLCLNEGKLCTGGETCGGYGKVAVWDSIEHIETTTEQMVPISEELADNSNHCKETNTGGILFMCSFTTFICGIMSVCGAMYFAHRYRPEVLKHVLDCLSVDRYEVEGIHGHTMTNIDSRPKLESPGTSPSTTANKSATERDPQIRHSYYADQHTNCVIPEYFPIQEDPSLWDTTPLDYNQSRESSSNHLDNPVRRTYIHSPEDISSSFDQHNVVTKDTLAHVWNQEKELAYAVADVTVLITNPTTTESPRSSQDDTFPEEHIEYVDPDQCRQMILTGLNIMQETVLSSAGHTPNVASTDPTNYSNTPLSVSLGKPSLHGSKEHNTNLEGDVAINDMVHYKASTTKRITCGSVTYSTLEKEKYSSDESYI